MPDMTPASSRIVIAGANGQVGRILARHFHGAGHSVLALVRKPVSEPWETLAWNGRDLGEWSNRVDGADVVINLAGRSVNCRYNARNRQEIMDSRVDTTRLIGQAIARSSRPPRVWLNASTATIYRHALDRPMDEATGELGGSEPNAPDTWRFSIDVATRWEEAFFSAPAPNTRKVAMRSAMIMSPDRGGIFDTLLRLVRFGFGGRAGSGDQFVSWIHETDFVRSLEFLIAHPELDGTVNLSSPHPLPNREFMRTLRRAWGTPLGLPADAWMIEAGAVFLRTESELILKSRRVIPGRLLEAGFPFIYAEWQAAAQELVDRARRHRN